MKSITVTGVLVADQWEPDGRIAGLALLTDDERKYLISPGDFGADGEDFESVLRKKIEVSAVLIAEPQERRLRVLKYSPVNPGRGWP